VINGNIWPPASERGTRKAVVFMLNGETEEEAVERHYRERPEDRGVSYVVVRFLAAKDGRPD